MHRTLTPPLVLSLLIALTSFSRLASAASGDGVKITELSDRVRVEINGELFTEYFFKMDQHPAITTARNGASVTNPTTHTYFYPLIGPGGAQMTRGWPIKNDMPGEEKDHPHHRSLWFSHGDVNGIDFWAETPRAGKIRHDRFIELKSGKDQGAIRETCQWVAPDGKVVCTDERVFRVYNRPAHERLFDFEITIKAPPQHNVVFGDTKEGTMAVRVNEEMRLTRGRQPGKGRIVQSTGVTGNQTWGKRAEWCDYSGPVNGKEVGIAIFDHPSNPVHPTHWHVRDYGLFAANPFGIHDFEKKEPGTGNMTIAAGKSATFKYRFYIHEGDEKKGNVAERYKEYVSATGAK